MFIGRDQELAALHRALSDSEWHLLHIHGQGGIGKTTLLKMFADMIGTDRCFYFDGNSGFQKPEDFLNQVRNALPDRESSEEPSDDLNEYAFRRQGIMILLDTFERWGAIENWLRNEWFPRLSPLVKVCTAGRFILEDRWLRDGWNLLMKNAELKPLSSKQVGKYAYSRGITDQEIVLSLQRFSNGVPLALSMSCEIIARQGNAAFLDLPQQQQTIGYLASELTATMESDWSKRCIEAASVVWKFDQELLQALLDEKIPTEHFREFCKLPFIIWHEDNWSLHDSVRQWTFADLRSRMPQIFRDYRSRAWKELRNREQRASHAKTELSFERIYMHENDFIRQFCFQWDDSLMIRECAEHDLERLERLYLQYLEDRSLCYPEELQMMQLIRPLWEIDPNSFIGLWQDNELVAFCSCVALTEQTVRLFRGNPITAPATTRYNPDQSQCLISMAGMEPHLENEISGSIARAMASLINRHTYILNLISEPNWKLYLSLLGYERQPWADSRTSNGVVYEGYLLDLRTEDLPSKIDRILTAKIGLYPVVQEESLLHSVKEKIPLEIAVKLVQRALKYYSKLPLYPETAQSLSSLLSIPSADMEADVIASHFKERCHGILRKLAAGTEEDYRFYQILHYAYIQKIGSHERVAEYLNMSVPTYYRYLKYAVRKLAYELNNSS
ncbi:AAA family ATPase [Cohnella terricola]|uniref:AAA family ATPase n=1 Tax=Cohnella terricola TaxID=1289167 RepID=UPI001648D33F|nr:AAA family ATPase [Cohnella terricola]